MNYYNDIDPNCCAWIRQLIADGLIPDGYVDERSITEVRPSDLAGYDQCHFFAGIAGWSYALALAHVDPRRRLWTASCPCQPFSAAGLQMGSADSRHLFPAFRRLVARCNPPVCIGEQVASALGREWFARVRLEMATLGYATRAGDYCAAGVAAPQLRQRLFWCASNDGVGDGHDPRSQGWGEHRDRASERSPWASSVGVCGNDGTWRRVEPGIPPLAHGLPGRVALIRGSGNAIVPQCAARFIEAALPSYCDRGLNTLRHAPLPVIED